MIFVFVKKKDFFKNQLLLLEKEISIMDWAIDHFNLREIPANGM